MKWNVDFRAEIMLQQVSFSGVKAWMTHHANVKGSKERQYNRKEEWESIVTLVMNAIFPDGAPNCLFCAF